MSTVKSLSKNDALQVETSWTDIWICPIANGHIQATGRDAKGRKQYRYHPRWREVRDETKYSRMIAFGEALPVIRARVAHDISLPGLPHEKVLATIVWLLDTTAISRNASRRKGNSLSLEGKYGSTRV